MTGLLWSRVRTGNVDCPPSWKERLAGGDVVVRHSHRRMWEAVPAISRQLGAIGIEFALVKGVAAEARWYDRTGERPSRDLDLLVAPSDVPRVGDVVAALDPHNALRESFQDMFERGLVQSIDLRVNGIVVDLHLDLLKLGPPCRHPDRLWARTAPFPLPDGSSVRVLDTELSLVHFLFHLNRDSYCWLLGFADVARILDREQIDWDTVARLAADEGLEATVWNGLAAVAETLGLPCPPYSPGGWRGRVWRVLWRPSVRLQGDMGWLRYRHRPYWLPVVADVGWRPTLRWARGQLTLSPGLAVHANPGSRGPWWWRLVQGRFARAVMRRKAVGRLRKAG